LTIALQQDEGHVLAGQPTEGGEGNHGVIAYNNQAAKEKRQITQPDFTEWLTSSAVRDRVS
jgi:hypothetical protein